MIDHSLYYWLQQNKMSMSESDIDSDILLITGVGRFLYIHPNEKNKIIDSDFTFILTTRQRVVLDNKQVDYILFSFGGKFYYSALRVVTNAYGEEAYEPEFNDFKCLGICAEDVPLSYCNIGVHDEYELLSGSGSVDLWCKKAKFLGHKIIGVCNKNTLASVLAFQTAAQNYGLHSIIGETIDIVTNYNPDEQVQETGGLKLYVENEQGWHNLLMINKLINVDYDKFIPIEQLSCYTDGLCAVISTDSEFNYLIQRGRQEDAMRWWQRMSKYFTHIYYQIDTVEAVSDAEFRAHLTQLDHYMSHWCNIIPPILINDSYYLDAEQALLKPLLSKVARRPTVEAKDQYFKSVLDTLHAYEAWYDTTPVLLEIIVKAIENLMDWVSCVDFVIDTSERKLPKFDTKGVAVEDFFFARLQQGFDERLKNKTDVQLQPYIQRLQTECDVIVPNGLCDYFLILWDIMHYCHDNDIITGPGRGSVCGSLVAYLLYITDVDPLQYGLLFERFLNETRVRGTDVWQLTLDNGTEIIIPCDNPIPIVGGIEVTFTDVSQLIGLDIDTNRL